MSAAVRVVQAADPLVEAARLAGELGADVAVDVGAAEKAVRTRVEAGRRAAGADGAGDTELLGRAPEIRAAAAAAPPISDDVVEELRQLAADLGRAARIRQRTESKAAELLQAKVAASTGVALHPEAVRTAAEAVVAAESALAAATGALEQRPARPGTTPAATEAVEAIADPVLKLPHDDFDEAHLERRRGLLRAVVLVAVVLGAAGVAVAAGAPGAVLPGGAVVALLFATLALARGRRAAGRVDDAVAHLEAAVRAVESTPLGQLAASLETEEAWVAEQARVEAARDEAEEQLRLARNRWHQLAGPGADPHDPDAVVRAHDPQLAYDPRASDASPTVRTVAAFHRRVQARWRVVWASLGWEDPPEPEDLERILDEALASHRTAAEALARVEAAESRQEAAATVRRPLVLVEPRTWVAPGRLAQLLASVPPEGEVVLVEREGAASGTS